MILSAGREKKKSMKGKEKEISIGLKIVFGVKWKRLEKKKAEESRANLTSVKFCSAYFDETKQ